MLGVRFEIADVGLGVSAGPVQQEQHRPAGLTGMQIAGPDTVGVQVPPSERNALKVTPNALELRHARSSSQNGPSACDYVILFFCARYVLISLIDVHYL